MTPRQSVGVAIYLLLIFGAGWFDTESQSDARERNGGFRYAIGLLTIVNTLTLFLWSGGIFSTRTCLHMTVRSTLAHLVVRQTVAHSIGASKPDWLAAEWSVVWLCPLYYYNLTLLNPPGWLAAWIFLYTTATKVCAFHLVWSDALLDAAVDAGACALMLFCDWCLYTHPARVANARNQEAPEEPGDNEQTWLDEIMRLSNEEGVQRVRMERTRQEINAIYPMQ